jgi:hypothetical protein
MVLFIDFLCWGARYYCGCRRQVDYVFDICLDVFAHEVVHIIDVLFVCPEDNSTNFEVILIALYALPVAVHLVIACQGGGGM